MAKIDNTFIAQLYYYYKERYNTLLCLTMCIVMTGAVFYTVSLGAVLEWFLFVFINRHVMSLFRLSQLLLLPIPMYFKYCKQAQFLSALLYRERPYLEVVPTRKKHYFVSDYIIFP